MGPVKLKIKVKRPSFGKRGFEAIILDLYSGLLRFPIKFEREKRIFFFI